MKNPHLAFSSCRRVAFWLLLTHLGCFGLQVTSAQLGLAEASRPRQPLRVSTFAGSVQGSQDGFRTEATFSYPWALALGPEGQVFVTEAYIPDFFSPPTGIQRIRMIDASGMVSLYAGAASGAGSVDGPRLSARFGGPNSLALDRSGTLIVCERLNYRIRKIDRQGLVTTFVGSSAGHQDGVGTNAQFNLPIGICLDSNENLYVADFQNSVIRKVTPSGEVSTYAGTPGRKGNQDGFRSSATFAAPGWVAASAEGALYVADWENGNIRRIGADGMVSTFAGGLAYIQAVGVDRFGSVYASVPPGLGAHQFLKFDAAGHLEWSLGNAVGFQDGPASLAQFEQYSQPLFLPDGNILIADGPRLRLIEISPGDCVSVPASATSWWRAEGDGKDLLGSAEVAESSGVTYQTGKVGQAFYFDQPGDHLRIQGSSATDAGQSGDFTVEAWINPTDVLAQHPIVEWNSGSQYGVHLYLSVNPPYGSGPGCIYADLRDSEGRDHWFTTGAGVVRTGEFQHVALTYKKESGQAAIYLNGVLLVQQSLGSFVPLTSYDLWLGYRPPGFDGSPFTFLGSMDEVTLYRRALHPEEIRAVYTAGSAGKCPPSSPATRTYDLRADWSYSSNPNGPWAFWSDRTLLPFVDNWTLDVFNPPQAGWAFGSTIPFWFRSSSAPAREVDWQIGDVVVHTHTPGTPNGLETGLASVTWTSPTNGLVDLAGAVWQARDIPDIGGGLRGNRWNLYLRGTLLSTGTIGGGDPYSRTSPFRLDQGAGGSAALLNRRVNIGDVVRLEFVPTTAEGDYVGVDLSVTIKGIDPLPGLIAHWRFDEVEGAVARDSVGTFDGNRSAGTSLVAGGLFGNAVALRRSESGVVNMGNVLGLTDTSFSIATWIKMNPGDANENSLVVAKHEAGINNGYFIVVNRSNTYIGQENKAAFYAGNPYAAATSTTSVNDGRWHHLVAVHEINGPNLLYVDGVLEGSAPSEPVAISSAPFLVGGASFNFTPQGLFTGLMDEMQIYSRSLTSNEVAILFGDSPEPALEYAWVSTLTGSGAPAFQDGPPATASFSSPNGGYVGSDHAVYIADTQNHRIRRLDLASGTTASYAGSGAAGAKNGPAPAAEFNQPLGVFVDTSGTVFVADSGNHQIRKINSSATGEVSTVAGSGLHGYVDGPADEARFDLPNDLVVDQAGNLFISEFNNHTIRKLSVDGKVSTFVGNGSPGFDDGLGIQAGLNQPAGLAIDKDGTLYVTEWGSHRVRRVTPEGRVTTLAGSVFAGQLDGQGVEARFFRPDGIAVNSSGTVFVAENGNHAVRRISPSGVVSTIAGHGSPGYVDGFASLAQFSGPGGIGIDPAGNLFIADTGNHRIRQISSLSLPRVSVEPATNTVPAGSRVEFISRATGSGPYAYQWKHNGRALAGATGAHLTLTDVQVDQSGSYSVVLGNPVGSVESAAVVLVVVTPIRFERFLPLYYSPGNAVTVRLEMVGGATALGYAYAVEEEPPAHWSVGAIGAGGVYDAANHKIKFGPFFDSTRKVFTYELIPPVGEAGTKLLRGVTSSDGSELPVLGADTLLLAPLHPADVNPADGRISVSEVTAYGAAWRLGQPWSVDPNPIPVDYVTRAGLLWKNGERYRFDVTVSRPPLWWVNATNNVIVGPQGPGRASMTSLSSLATRILPASIVAGESYDVRVLMEPAEGVSAYAVEEHLGPGLEAAQVSDDGQIDLQNRFVRWGPFFDNAKRELRVSVTLKTPDATTARFTGFASVDGVSFGIAGPQEVPVGFRLGSPSKLSNGDIRIAVGLPDGRRFLIEASPDLQWWVPLATVSVEYGALRFREPILGNPPQRFYRAVNPRP